MSTRKVRISRKKTLKFNKIYQGLSGSEKSEYVDNKHIVYGELCDESISILYEIFARYAPLSKIVGSYRNFYDIGSGIGKAVLGMAALNSSLRLTGIEIKSDLVMQANTALQRIRDNSVRNRVEFLCLSCVDDSIQYDKACWVYVSNEGFDSSTNETLIQKLDNELKPGAVVVCSKEIYSSNFQKLNYMTLPMSWSDDTKVFVYKKMQKKLNETNEITENQL
jgi:SAM-dependent methyltransferase